ncbi:MAG TPA: SDR family oxidoreductase [Methyloceanibacter sp.]|nr:SDR family oxidoreductase [Methyloceanibacter sp.]
MLLQNKTAVIYGGGGAIGSAVARAFAREGAKVFLAGRTLAMLDAVADEIVGAGGVAEAAEVNAFDEETVQKHVDSVVSKAGAIDILFNAIGMQDVQGTPLIDMPLDDFMCPIVTAAKTQFVTARAVGRRMAQNGSGVMLTITAGPPEAVAYIGGFGPACGAIEGLWRGLAAELGPRGVRVICLRSAGSPDTPDVQLTFELHAKATGVTLQEFLAGLGGGTLLRRLPSSAEIANVAAMMASDRASAMTGTFVSVTCGSRFD